MKKTAACIAAITIVLGIFAAPGYGATVILYPTLDLFVGSGLPDTNTDNNYLYIGSSGGTNMSFLKFDLSLIPDNSIITSADLRLRTHSFSPVTVDIYRVQTIGDVTSATTWNNQPAIAEKMGSFVPENGFNTWTLGASELFNDLLDNSASLRLSTESGFVSFISANYGSGAYEYFYDPQLTVTYGPAAVPIPAAVWLFGAGLLGLIGMKRKMK